MKPSQAGLLQHFTQIADASELPIILYNVPGRTGVDLSVETTIKLASHPMIQGLKDATGDNNRVAPIHAVCSKATSASTRARTAWHAVTCCRAVTE